MTLPKPVGWRLLLKPHKPPQQTAGGIWKPEEVVDRETYVALAAQVVDMGPDCYKDTAKFNEPWCKVGDWVMLGRYAGNRFKYKDDEYRFLNDDEILGVLEDPNSVGRISA